MSFLDFFAYTVVISRETVKSPKNTIFDTCAQNSWRYEFSYIFAHTVVTSRKNGQIRYDYVLRHLCTELAEIRVL